VSQVKHLILAKAYDKRNRQISQSYNSWTKTHPLQKHFSIKSGVDWNTNSSERVFLHAELYCIIRAKQQIDHMTVERYGATGKMLLARPCESCWLAIKEAGITFVEYTTPTGWTLEYI
jgi:tRNA(Arg) A34 adenosine deaminase TadA